MNLNEIESTKDIEIPKSPLERIIGQDKAVEKVKTAIKQRRNLLLFGPPGIGKSMLAKAIALNLPPPKEEIRVLENPANLERPLIEIVSKEIIEEEKKRIEEIEGKIVTPTEIPTFISEQLGFRCSSCGVLSSPDDVICKNCGANKFPREKFSKQFSPFSDILTNIFEISRYSEIEKEVAVIKVDNNGKESIVVYQRVGENIRILDQEILEKFKKLKEKRKFKVLVPLNRIPFVHATGASETELLGDVRHDPYGSHKEIGTPTYLRVIPGAIHEAHEGVLFIDELPHMAHLQNFILTAMQDKKFPITGRNPHSAGASVKVDSVPCDFIFVGACNIQDIEKILPPLRSRILGNGYEILLETFMPDTDENKMKIAQFIAQEIKIDGKIPDMKREGIEKIIEEGKKRALMIDNAKNSITLRLRDLGGLIRLAGDFAIKENSGFIEEEHVEKSISECKPIEHQIKEKYGSIWKGIEKEKSIEGGEGYGVEKGYR